MIAKALKRDGALREKIKKAAGHKPDLTYLEIHLLDHCNLNCKGYGHFAPIAGKHFADLSEYERDMK